MTADTPSYLVPKLRFPEFQEAPAWSIEPIGRLFHERQETGFSELPLLSVTDRDGVIPQEETNRKNTANSNKAKYLRVVPGDIVYNTMRMWEGRSARVGKEGVVSPAYTVCRPNVATNSYFFAYYFKTRSLINQFRKYSQGLVKDTLNLKYEAFSLISVGFPPPNEQQKIADCLGTLDDLIAAEGRKLEALRQHKQGLMQQLLPQPWRNSAAAARPRVPQRTGMGGAGARRCFGSSHVQTDIRQPDQPEWRGAVLQDRNTGRRARRFHPPKDLFEEYKSQYHFPRPGEILITCSGTVGKCLAYDGSEAYFQDSNIVWIDNPTLEVSNEFLLSILSNVNWSTLNSTTITRIYGPDLRGLAIKYPQNKQEQERIANCLSVSRRSRTDAQARKLHALRQHKQGLLQQLFPSLEG